MDADELFLIEALVAVLPYVVVKSGDWLGGRMHGFSLRRAGSDSNLGAPF